MRNRFAHDLFASFEDQQIRSWCNALQWHRKTYLQPPAGVPERDLFYANISERAGARLKEDLENTGATRLRDVEAAQQAIVAVVRALQESGEITLRAAEAPAEEDGEEYV